MQEIRSKSLPAARAPRPGVRLYRRVALTSVCIYVGAHAAVQSAVLFGDASHATLSRWVVSTPARLLAPVLFYLPLSTLVVLWIGDRRLTKAAGGGEMVSWGGALGFLGLHWSHVALPYVSGDQGVRHVSADLVSSLSSTHAGVPVVALLYLLGLAVWARCLVGGLRHLLRESSLLSRSAQQRLSWLVGGTCFVLGCSAIVRLATGAPPW